MFNKPRIPGFTIFHNRSEGWGWRQERPGPDGKKHEQRGYQTRNQAYSAAVTVRKRIMALESLVS